MKTPTKIAIFLLLALPVIGLTALLYFRPQIEGVKPAVLPPSQDIAELIQNPGQNNTEFPLEVAEGFAINIFAEDLGKARVLAIDPGGRLVTSIPERGQVVALEDTDGDGVADNQIVVAEDLDRPHGLAFRCQNEQECELYIAEVRQVAKFEYNSSTAKASDKETFVSLPGGGRHNTRTLQRYFVGDQEKMLISVGSACDVCYESNPIHGTVQITDLNTPSLTPFATGLRNAVFLATHPVTGHVWVTEMGRDNLGDNLPPDEINILQAGSDYGWPECFGQNVLDRQFANNRAQSCQGKTPSHINLQAHVAPLGLAFVPEEGWPESYWFDLLVAYHGSWNRTEPVGYKVERIQLDDQGNPTGEREDFISGWLQADGTALGRPVDVLTMPGGITYISDDKAGVIYRVVLQQE